jgi:hypothetical protein
MAMPALPPDTKRHFTKIESGVAGRDFAIYLPDPHTTENRTRWKTVRRALDAEGFTNILPAPPRKPALSETERLLLADLVRRSFIASAQLCPKGAQHTARTGCGFSAWLLVVEHALGQDYRPQSTASDNKRFPLTGRQVHAIANDLELNFAGSRERMIAALLVRHCPMLQPERGGRHWRLRCAILDKAGLNRGDPCTDWIYAIERLLASMPAGFP